MGDSYLPSAGEAANLRRGRSHRQPANDVDHEGKHACPVALVHPVDATRAVQYEHQVDSTVCKTHALTATTHSYRAINTNFNWNEHGICSLSTK